MDANSYPDLITPIGAETPIDARLLTSMDRTLILFQELRQQLDNVQDRMIICPENDTAWIEKERGRYSGIQDAANVFLRFLPSSFTEQEIAKLAAMVKLVPKGKISTDGRIVPL